jgi:hypothetical protein
MIRRERHNKSMQRTALRAAADEERYGAQGHLALKRLATLPKPAVGGRG